jgi:pyruvate carboxylase
MKSFKDFLNESREKKVVIPHSEYGYVLGHSHKPYGGKPSPLRIHVFSHETHAKAAANRAKKEMPHLNFTATRKYPDSEEKKHIHYVKVTK